MVSVASDFDANWIEEDESKGSSYGSVVWHEETVPKQ